MLLVMHLKAEQETELLKDIEYRVKWMDLKKLVFLRYASASPLHSQAEEQTIPFFTETDK